MSRKGLESFNREIYDRDPYAEPPKDKRNKDDTPSPLTGVPLGAGLGEKRPKKTQPRQPTPDAEGQIHFEDLSEAEQENFEVEYFNQKSQAKLYSRESTASEKEHKGLLTTLEQTRETLNSIEELAKNGKLTRAAINNFEWLCQRLRMRQEENAPTVKPPPPESLPGPGSEDASGHSAPTFIPEETPKK